jgi:hypothetical protein
MDRILQPLQLVKWGQQFPLLYELYDMHHTLPIYSIFYLIHPKQVDRHYWYELESVMILMIPLIT